VDENQDPIPLWNKSVFSKGIESNRNPEKHKNHNMDVSSVARLLLELGSNSWASKK